MKERVRETVRVKDHRNKGWFWAFNEIFDLYGATLGPNAITVYLYLCRRADEDGRSHPSGSTIAEQTGMSRATVKRAIHALESHEPPLIAVAERVDENGRQSSNEFLLLDIKTSVVESKKHDGKSEKEGVHTAPGGVHTAPGGGSHSTPLIKEEKDDPMKDDPMKERGGRNIFQQTRMRRQQADKRRFSPSSNRSG